MILSDQTCDPDVVFVENETQRRFDGGFDGCGSSLTDRPEVILSGRRVIPSWIKLQASIVDAVLSALVQAKHRVFAKVSNGFVVPVFPGIVVLGGNF